MENMDKEIYECTLKPTLGLLDATAINVGAIIGAGIFIVIGIVASLAGPALIFSILIAAIVALFTTLSFAELAVLFPKEGSVYEFAYQLISPFAGFLAGWIWIISNIFTGAAVSLGFAYYLIALFPSLCVKCVAVILCIVFTILNFIGIRQSAILNNFLVIAKLFLLALFIIFGLKHINLANFTPLFPFRVGVFYGAYYFFFAYGGFARVTIVTEEVKDAIKNVPKAMILSLFISTIFYVLVSFVAIGLVGSSRLSNSNYPLVEAIKVTRNQTVIGLVSAGGLLATASVLLTSILGVSRMVYAMARRKDLLQVLSKLHPKYNTPYYSIWSVGIFMVLLVLLIDFTKVVAISTFAQLLYYAIANVSALRLRKRLYPSIVPVLGVFSCLVLLILTFFIFPKVFLIGILGLMIGVIYYIIFRFNLEIKAKQSV